MSTVTIELNLPDDLTTFTLPPALDERLTRLLDKQDHQGSLPESERAEADALCNLVEMLSLLKLRATRRSNESPE